LFRAERVTVPTQDIVVFDEESDRHIIIPWEDAVAASFCTLTGVPNGMTSVAMNVVMKAGAGLATGGAPAYFGVAANGAAAGGVFPVAFNAAGNVAASDDLCACEWRDLANCWRLVAKYGVRKNFGTAAGIFPCTDLELAFVTGGTGAIATDPFTISDRFRGRNMQAFMEVAEFRVYCVVTRPFIEHMMMSAIMTVSGRETGAMLFGPSDMQISANTQVKTIEGHYTGHFKAVINKPQNVFVMRDVACASYVAGMNTMFFGHQSGLPIGTRYDSARARSQVMRRLSFADEMGAKYHSCLSFAVSAMEYESGSLDTVMSVTSRLLPWEVNTSNTHDSFPGGETMFKEYDRILNLKQIHYGEDVRAAENMEFISQGATNNALCFMGPHRKFSRISRSHFELIPGQGHFGPDALPGVSILFNRTSNTTRTHAKASAVSTPFDGHRSVPCTGCALAARRDGLAEDGARPDDFAGGGGVEPAGLPATRLSRRTVASVQRRIGAFGRGFKPWLGLQSVVAPHIRFCVARSCVSVSIYSLARAVCVTKYC
jgi:hypothetical protein